MSRQRFPCASPRCRRSSANFSFFFSDFSYIRSCQGNSLDGSRALAEVRLSPVSMPDWLPSVGVLGIGYWVLVSTGLVFACPNTLYPIPNTQYLIPNPHSLLQQPIIH